MIRIESVLAAAVALAAASTAVAGDLGATPAATAIDIPAQVFAHDPAGARPVIESKWGPYAATQTRNWAVGRNFQVSLPLGAGERLPLRVHIYSSEEECHDSNDFTAAAALRNQEQDFIRGGDHD